MTIELVPMGDEARARTIHTAVIANDGTGTKSQGNYRYALSRRGSTKPWKVGKLHGFPRLRLGAWQLLYRVLAEALDQGPPPDGIRKLERTDAKQD